MRSFPVSLCVLALSIGVPAFGQDAVSQPAQAAAQDAAAPLASSLFSTFERGDGILSLSLGATVPLGFFNPNTSSFEAANSYPGFAFSLSYAGFLNESWALAGDLAGGYVSTKSDRRLFIAPLSMRVMRVFSMDSFVIAPSAGLGVAICALNESKHVDPLVKIGSSFMWRASSDMSYALNVFGNVIPQIFQDPINSRVGFFMEATLSVAYHL